MSLLGISKIRKRSQGSKLVTTLMIAALSLLASRASATQCKLRLQSLTKTQAPTPSLPPASRTTTKSLWVVSGLQSTSTPTALRFPTALSR